jgi:hypothetical protein
LNGAIGVHWLAVMRASPLLLASALCSVGCGSLPLRQPHPDAAAVPADAAVTDGPVVSGDGSDALVLTVPPGATVVASGQASPALLALDQGNVYWLNLGIYDAVGPKVWFWHATHIMKCAKSGCPGGATVLVAGRFLSYGSVLRNIATDGESVFWSDDGLDASFGTSETGGGLLRCSVTGCDNSPQVLDPFPVEGIAAAAGRVYATYAYGGKVATCPTSGCASPPDLLWSAESGGLNSQTVAIVADATDVFWTTQGRVMRCALTGCDNTPTILASSGDAYVWSLGPIALSADTVFFGHGLFFDGSTQRDGEILACAKSGCAGNPTVIATSAYGPTNLATDGIDVYWIERDAPMPQAGSGPYALRRCPVTGCAGPPATLVSGLANAGDLAIDDTHVYWTELGDWLHGGYGRIWRAPK